MYVTRADTYLTPAILSFLTAMAYGAATDKTLKTEEREKAKKALKLKEEIKGLSEEEKKDKILSDRKRFFTLLEKVSLLTRGTPIHNYLSGYPQELQDPREVIRYILNKWKDETKLWQFIPNVGLYEGGLKNIAMWSRPLWTMIHVWSLTKDRGTFTAWIAFILDNLPCEKCRTHSKEYLQKNEIVDPFSWAVKFHYNIPKEKGDVPESILLKYKKKYTRMIRNEEDK